MSSSPPDRLHLPVVDTDECASDVFVSGQDPIEASAATWLIRRSNGLDAAGKAQLQAWLDADPRHAEAFASMDATLRKVKKLSADEVASLKAGLPSPPAPRPSPAALQPSASGPRKRQATWSHWLPQAAVAAMVFIVAGVSWTGWQHWRQQPTFAQNFATERGQQQTIALPDAGAMGSTVQLDTATRLEARLYRDRREVQLQEGQAMFSVKPDGERPFHVWAGALRITVVGTRFSVRHTASGLGAGKTVVAVEEGRVQVARANSMQNQVGGLAPELLELSAGQTAMASETGDIARTASVAASAIAPWRSGRISFDQTPLSQAIAEFERYERTGLVVLDPQVAALPVGGSYSLKQWTRFAETLPQMLPVQIVKHGETMEVVAR